MSQPVMNSKILSIKMLLSNNLSGSLIGLGGRAIKDLMEVSGARVHVSSSSDPYPGTSDRVVLISGDLDSVTLAQSLIWEMIALVTCSENPKEVEWNPKDMVNFIGQNDGADVSGKLTVPASAAGLMIGKAGANIQHLSDESGASVLMNSKEEAMFTQERIVSITGSLGSCMKAASMILQKLDESPEPIAYVNKGTSYSTAHLSAANPFAMPFNPAYGMYGGGMMHPMGMPGMSGVTNVPGGMRGGAGRGGGRGMGMNAPDVDGIAQQVETTISFTVPDELVGNILGKQGTTMREIISISKAKVNISPRGELVDGGSSNRVVTITGTPANAQTAHMLINQRLQAPQPQRRNN